MAAEGARGQTAREMGEVLGFPESLRYTGTDGQKIPWEMGKLHVGQSEHNRLLHTSDAESPEQATRKQEETTLANRLEVVRKKKEEAMEREDHQELGSHYCLAASQSPSRPPSARIGPSSTSSATRRAEPSSSSAASSIPPGCRVDF
jgi:hypothetical protein